MANQMTKHTSYYQGARPEVAPFLPDNYSRVLEIGCGNGAFRQLMTDNCEYWGVEPVEAAAQEADQRLDKVLHNTFDEAYAQLPNHYFDLVICNDVIEHLPDHEQFFRKIREKMAPGGQIIGSVPNVRYYKNLFALLVTKDWRYTAKGILDSTHLRFFTKKSLLRSFRANGFQAERLQFINSAVYLKRKYCTSALKTTANIVKFAFRFSGFLLFDIVTLGHSSDIKYAQIGFRFRIEN